MKLFKAIWLCAFFFLFTGNARADDEDGKGGNKQEQTEDQKQIAALKEENERLKKAAGKKKGTKDSGEDDEEENEDDNEDDDDLRKRARKERETSEKTAATTKSIEKALTFNLSLDQFLTANKELLPNEIPQIVKLANQETYDNASAKANAIKSAVIQSYFSLQSNEDALTTAQKSTLDDYRKLSKTGREAKAAEVYENIFEPALETFRKVKKAEELGRGRAGLSNDSDSDRAYKDKLIRMSRKTHLGEKGT